MGMGNLNKPEDFNKTPEGFAETLTAFAQYVADNFRGSKYNLKMEKMKVLKSNRKLKHFFR